MHANIAFKAWCVTMLFVFAGKAGVQPNTTRNRTDAAQLLWCVLMEADCFELLNTLHVLQLYVASHYSQFHAGKLGALPCCVVYGRCVAKKWARHQLNLLKRLGCGRNCCQIVVRPVFCFACSFLHNAVTPSPSMHFNITPGDVKHFHIYLSRNLAQPLWCAQV